MSGAALRPASVLDGFFTADVEAVAAAQRALLASATGATGAGATAAGAADADRSWGRVEEASALVSGGRRTEPKGIYSEVIFGPRRVLRCACGALKGEEHRDETCATCGVLCGDPSLRDWRFGHVDVPVALHPLLLREVAAALAMSLDGVVAVLGSDGNPTVSGPHALAAQLADSAAPQALKDAAIVRRVPVPPPGDRRLVLNLTATQVTPWIGPLNEAWLALVARAGRLARLELIDAPDILVAQEARWVQDALARVVALTVTPPAPHAYDAWSAPREREVDAAPETIAVGGVPPAIELIHAGNARVVFVDAFTFVVQRGTEVLHMDIDGKRKQRFRSPGRALRSVHGSRVVFAGWLQAPHFWPIAYPDFDDADPAAAAAAAQQYLALVAAAAGSMAELAVYDLAAKAWLDAWPAELSCITAQRGDPHELTLVNRATGAFLPCRWRGNDDPTVLAWSADARFAWLGADADGGVVDVASGIPQIEPRVDEGREAGLVESPGEAACAIGLTDELAWRFVHFDGTLSDGKKAISNLGVFECVAFSPGCRWTATVRARDVEVYDGAGHLSRRFRLP